LARRRLEWVSLGALAASGLAVDLLALAIWLDIDSESYAKLVGVMFVGSIFGLLVLGLTLACQPGDSLARYLYVGSVSASLVGAVIATVLILTTGGGDLVPASGPFPVGFADDNLLKPLAAILVLLAALWFSALAASRVERLVD